MGYIRYVVPLTVLYLALTANLFEWRNWLLGLVLAIGIVALIRPKPSPVQWQQFPRTTLEATKFVVLLFVDLFVSGIQVAKLVLQKDPDIQQGIVAIPSQTKSEWITTISAEAITLTPGEMVVEIGEDGTMYTHTLYVDQTLSRSIQEQAERVRRLEEITS